MITTDQPCTPRVRVIRHQSPSPVEDPGFRGAGVDGVPGDIIAVDTADGTLFGKLLLGEVPDGGPFVFLRGDRGYIVVGDRVLPWTKPQPHPWDVTFDD